MVVNACFSQNWLSQAKKYNQWDWKLPMWKTS